MSIKTSFALAIIFIVLGTFALFDPLQWKAKKEESKEKASHVFWLKDQKLEWFALHSSGVRTLIECASAEGCAFDSNGTWRTKEPASDTGDSANIGAFLSSLKNLAPVEQVDIEPSASLAEYGLDKSTMLLEFKLKDKAEIQYLKFGNASAIGPNIYGYASSTPNKLYLIASFFSDQVKKPFFHWRNKKFFPELSASDVKYFSWKNAVGKDFVFERVDGEWKMLSPLKVSANPPMIDGLLNTILFLQAESVAYEEKLSLEAKKILAQKIVLQVNLDKEKKTQLAFYAKESKMKPQYYATSPNRGKILVVDGTSLNRFNKELIEFRNRKLFTTEEKDRIQSAELYFPREKKSITLERSGSDWKRSAGADLKSGLSQKRTKNFIDALSMAQVREFVSSLSSAWKQPADLELVLKNSEQKEMRKLRFVIAARKAALTEGELPSELRSFGEDFLKVMPVRLSDLEESNNKKVVTEEKKEDGFHNEHHDGHAH